MPRIDIQDFNDDEKDVEVIRIKTTKPRNPAVKEMFDGKFPPPKKHKDKRRSASRFDKRNIEF